MFDCKKFQREFMKGDKEDRFDILNERLEGFVEYFLGDFRNNPLKDEVYDLLLTKKFAKTLNKYVKEYSAPPELVLVIVDTFSKIKKDYHNSSEVDKANNELVTLYVGVINVLLEKRMKKICKSTGLPELVVQNVLIECPEELTDKKPAQQFMYIRRVLRKLYVIDTVYQREADATEINQRISNREILLKLFKILFGDGVIDKFCSVALLENRRNATLCSNMGERSKIMWNALTDVALMTIEFSGKKKDIAAWLDKYYVSRRRRDRDLDKNIERRISLLDVDSVKFPKIKKATEWMIDEDPNVEKFLQ